MTTFDRTWTYDQNNVPAAQSTADEQSENIWYEIKEALIVASPTGPGWTVTQSCDGSTTPDATDQWDAPSKLNWGTGTHSWIVLKSPDDFPSTGENLYLCLDLDQAGTDDIIIRTATADWTGGTTSGPGSGTNVASYTHQWRGLNANPRKWHLHASTEGDVILYVSEDSKGYAEFGMLMIACTDTQAGDSWPIFEFVDYDSAAPGAFEDANMSNATMAQGHWIDGTADPQTVLVWPHRGTSPITDSFDVNGDDNTGKYPAFPVYAVSYAANKVSVRGRIHDIRAGPTHAGIVQGLTSEPSGGAVTSIIVGHLWIPAGATASF